MKMMLKKAIPRPRGAKSNMPKGSPAYWVRNEAMMMLGGVPINVIIPPKWALKASGIR